MADKNTTRTLIVGHLPILSAGYTVSRQLLSGTIRLTCKKQTPKKLQLNSAPFTPMSQASNPGNLYCTYSTQQKPLRANNVKCNTQCYVPSIPAWTAARHDYRQSVILCPYHEVFLTNSSSSKKADPDHTE